MESSPAYVRYNQRSNLESYSSLVALSPSISKQCKLYERRCATFLQYIFPVFKTIFNYDANIGVIGARAIAMELFLENVMGLWIALGLVSSKRSTRWPCGDVTGVDIGFCDSLSPCIAFDALRSDFL